MDRRRFLAGLVAGLAASSAGCLGGSTATATPTAGDGAAFDGPRDGTLPVDESDLVRAAGRDEIPAIVDPAFGRDWSAVPETLGDRDRVIGVTADGRARAYPLAILNWHEVVNDAFGGPLLVTYCPLCGSGVTAERRADGRTATFGVSGYLWRRDLVLYDDATDSLWSQILGKAVRGPLTGEALALRPSTMTTWGEWRRTHPDTAVLLPPPESETVSATGERNYNTDPYSGYETYEPPEPSRDGSGRRLPPKELVLGVATDGAARAYPFKSVVEAGGVVNDRVGSLPVVVSSTHDSLVAYVRRAGGDILLFGRDGDTLVAGGSRWAVVSGRALDGPHEGVILERANDRSPMFWFAWVDFFPGTDVYGESG